MNNAERCYNCLSMSLGTFLMCYAYKKLWESLLLANLLSRELSQVTE